MDNDLSKLSNEELLKVSLEKNKEGNATKKALEAQEIIWNRAGRPFTKDHNNRAVFNNSMFEDDDFGFGNRTSDMYDDYIDKTNDINHKGL